MVRDSKKDDRKSENVQFEPEIVWHNVLLFAILHTGGFWGLWRLMTFQISLSTFIWSLAVAFASLEGVMVGSHRFFCHRTFKGNTWFKLLVVVTQTMAGQNCIYIWSRDHRLHHKYSDTDADPHNSTRGFFFCHMGWLLQRKHPLVKLKGKNIDMSDLEAEPLVMFQKKYYYLLYTVFAFGIPVFVPVYFWGESVSNALLGPYFLRYMLTLHGTWTVNSFAHLYGYRPYSKDIQPVESEFVAFISSGEGWHNFHHSFPWDYRAGEFGKRWNMSSHIVDWFASIGWAYDLKCATPEMVKYRVNKRGDGTHPSSQREKYDDTDDSTVKENMKTLLEDQSHSKFGEDDTEDIFGEKISSEGFTILNRAIA
ncbi:hypothetical protein GE061_010925 [Apolygus lucorum]|uniref:Fatty acid desaturase domain-containing protein n=1 Tax=Apolygus lucorum TaxID=248454 RepID=A0A8S9XXE9_APOLU|nr:hypothetical protein GE061_010925 [Apolygus lucorum]